VPQVDQGWGVNEITFCRFQEQVARYSGALAFLQTQHQSAASWLAQSSNLRLKQTYLPGMSSGQVRIGIGFSQLRRVERPSVTAQSVDGGYLLQGTVPWVTGFGCFQWFVIGAALANGQAVFGLVPFEHQIQATGGNIRFSEPIALAAMGSTNTVEAYLENWFLPDDQVIAVKEPGWITTNDQRNILKHSFFALGCAQAGLDLIHSASFKLPKIAADTWQVLEQALQNCRAAIYQAHSEGEMHDRLELRAQPIELAVRCAHAAVTVSRGAANYASHPAQRIYREALAFTVFGQTTAIMEATLNQIICSINCSDAH
jgi:alkylation response protein AidB-like acyl-CoA dehydrogenase